jgi:hypothetical protein
MVRIAVAFREGVEKNRVAWSRGVPNGCGRGLDVTIAEKPAPELF